MRIKYKLYQVAMGERKQLVIERHVVQPDQRCNHMLPPDPPGNNSYTAAPRPRQCETNVMTLAIYLNVYRTVYMTAGDLLASWRFCDKHGGLARTEIEASGWLDTHHAEVYSEKKVRALMRQVRQGKLRKKDLPWN